MLPERADLPNGADGQLTTERAEPIAADARPGKDSKLDVKLKLVAGMLGVGLDELKQREAHRRQVRMMWLVSASLAGMAITSGLAATAWFARNEAERERVRAESEAETARQTTNFLVGLFAVSDPNEARGNSITAREILDKGAAEDQPGAAHAAGDPGHADGNDGHGLHEPRALPSGGSLLEDALKKRRDLYGEDSLEVAQSAEKLGEVLTLTAEYDRAQPMYRSALAERRKLLGPEHVDIARSLYQLADLSSASASTRRPSPCIARRWRCRSSCLGHDSDEVAKSLEGLALNLYDQGKYDRRLPDNAPRRRPAEKDSPTCRTRTWPRR